MIAWASQPTRAPHDEPGLASQLAGPRRTRRGVGGDGGADRVLRSHAADRGTRPPGALHAFEPGHRARPSAHDVSLIGAVGLPAPSAPGLARGSRRAAARTVGVLYMLALAHAVQGPRPPRRPLLAFGLALVPAAGPRPPLRGPRVSRPRSPPAAIAVGRADRRRSQLEVGLLLLSGRASYTSARRSCGARGGSPRPGNGRPGSRGPWA